MGLYSFVKILRVTVTWCNVIFFFTTNKNMTQLRFDISYRIWIEIIWQLSIKYYLYFLTSSKQYHLILQLIYLLLNFHYWIFKFHIFFGRGGGVKVQGLTMTPQRSYRTLPILTRIHGAEFLGNRVVGAIHGRAEAEVTPPAPPQLHRPLGVVLTLVGGVQTLPALVSVSGGRDLCQVLQRAEALQVRLRWLHGTVVSYREGWKVTVSEGQVIHKTQNHWTSVALLAQQNMVKIMIRVK